jgi:hypothetical protein
MTKNKRKPVGKKLRFDVFKRDGFRCQYCGATPLQTGLQVDHIVPVAEGGDNGINNLITSCQPCNIGKGASPLTVVPKSLSQRAKDVAEREEQIRHYQAALQQAEDRIDGECWRVADTFNGFFGFPHGKFDRSKYESIRRFIQRVGVYECLRGAEVSLAAHKNYWSFERTFKYFCGVMWTKVRGQA